MTTTVHQETGWLLELNTEPLGSALIEDAPVGATVLHVNDAVDFEEDGGTLQLNGALIGYESCDPDADTITLNGPLDEAADVDDYVAVWDVENAAPAGELKALVEILGIADDDPVPAVLAHGLGSTLQRGPRDGRGETVVLEQYGPSWRVVDVLGKEHVLQLDDSDLGIKPAAPTDVTLSSATYVAAGQTQGMLTIEWDPVTEDVDGEELEEGVLDHYEVEFQRGAGVPTTPWSIGGTTAATATELTARPFEVGEEWAGRVRAVTAAGVASDWSEIDSTIIAADDDPPERPSAPTIATAFGMITLTWDGLDFLGDDMAADFAYVEVHRSLVNGFTPTPGDTTTMIDQIPRAASITIKGNFDQTYYFKLVAVDTSGNASTASSQATAIVKPLVDVSNFPDDAMEELYARTGHFIQLDADQVTANSAAIGFLETGIVVGGIFEARDGGEFRTNATPTSGGIRIRDADGFRAWNNSGTLMVSIDRATGQLFAQGADIRGNISAATITGSTFATATTAGYSPVSIASTGITLGSATIQNTSAGFDLLGSGGGIRIDSNSVDIAVGGTTRIQATSSGANVTGPLGVTGDLSTNGNLYVGTRAATTAAPNLRVGAGGEVFEANTSLGPADSGGLGYRLVRVPN